MEVKNMKKQLFLLLSLGLVAAPISSSHAQNILGSVDKEMPILPILSGASFGVFLGYLCNKSKWADDFEELAIAFMGLVAMSVPVVIIPYELYGLVKSQ